MIDSQRSRRELDAGDPMVVATPEEAVERFREWLHTPEGRLVGEACQRLWDRGPTQLALITEEDAQ